MKFKINKNEIKLEKSFSQKKQFILLFSFLIPIILIQFFIQLNSFTAFIFIFINLTFIGVCGEFLLTSGTKIAVKLGISSFIIGLVLIPAISSLPEDMILIMSNLKNKEVGNVMLAQALGNNLFELLVIFGISGFMACYFKKECVSVKNKREKMLVMRNGLILIIGSFLLTVLIVFDRNLTFIDSIILLLFYGMFILILYFSNKSGINQLDNIPEDMDLNKDEINGKKELGLFILFLGLIILLSNFFVADILYLFERSENFEKFAFLYIGIAVAIPTLIITMIAFIKGEDEIALGFVIGCCIWDMIVSIAFQGIVNPLYNISEIIIIFLLITTIISTLVAIIYIRTAWSLKLWETLSLIGIYIIIVISIIVLI